nr:MAG: hypothetical protein DIU78_26145 [Pseudomonadota bacterium]
MWQGPVGAHGLGRAGRLLEECHRIAIEEAEPRQHLSLTRAWFEIERGDAVSALAAVDSAAHVFGPHTRAGDHTPHLLGRLLRFRWPREARDRIEAWRRVLNDRGRRQG